MQDDIQYIFLVGAKSLGTYGGYETFISKLTEYHQNNEKIKYHVAVKANSQGCMDLYKTEGAEIIDEYRFVYHNADCFRIHVPEKLGPAQAVYYDVVALKECCKSIRKQGIQHPIVYIMVCRIGPFMKHYYKEIHELRGRVFLNPDSRKDIIWLNQKTPHKYRVLTA